MFALGTPKEAFTWKNYVDKYFATRCFGALAAALQRGTVFFRQNRIAL